MITKEIHGRCADKDCRLDRVTLIVRLDAESLEGGMELNYCCPLCRGTLTCYASTDYQERMSPRRARAAKRTSSRVRTEARARPPTTEG
jgi:hypothetical protein